MEDKLYCIKMLSRVGRHHLFGAERLGIYEEIEKISQELLQRAVAKGKGQLDSVHLNVAQLEHFNFRSASLPDFIQLQVKSYREGRNTARNLLSQAGVSSKAYYAAENLLTRSPEMGGTSIAGSYLIDSFSGEILNYDMEEGVWIGRVDLADPVEAKLKSVFKKLGLDSREIRDNLVLSAKIMGLSGFVGEINWSNDSSDEGGSITTPELGCVYFPFLRPKTKEVGGRVVFVRSRGFGLDVMIRYLESEVLIIDEIGRVR
jgi:6-carboxyhexanoate--CoA ligase